MPDQYRRLNVSSPAVRECQAGCHQDGGKEDGMRTLTEDFGTASAEHDVASEPQDIALALGDSAQTELEHVKGRSPATRAVRTVGLVAFGQSLLFLAIWALICASVGAATVPKKAEFNASVAISTYEPTKA